MRIYRCDGCGQLFGGEYAHRCPTRVWRDQPVPALRQVYLVLDDGEVVLRSKKPAKLAAATPEGP